MLIEKIKNRTAVVGVIGLGYVGLPLVIEFGKQNFPVIGFDVDPVKVKLLLESKSYIKHIPSDKVSGLIDTKKFIPTTDYSRISECDAILICVPTPLDHHREPDMSYVVSTCESIKPYIRKGQLISLESTTYPGTTDELTKSILEKSGLTAGKDFYLVYSPEREDPGNKDFNTSTIPKVVGAMTPEGLKNAVELYSAVIGKVVPVSSTRAAELTKLLENIYRNINIALVNELKMLCDRMDINIWEVIDAASTKPFGFHPFYPGPGLGGHCIPIDPFYLTWKAHEFDFQTKFIELAGEINNSVTYFVVQKMMDALNKNKKCINGAKILMLGMAYKKDIDDLRESPALKLIELLMDKGAVVDYNDPYIPSVPKVSPMRHYTIKMASVDLTPENLKNYDAILIVTDHSCYDYEMIVRESTIIVDSRNATKNVKEGRDKIYLA
ncbi:nucleotide sugar dehydrogenase [Myxococcota bacterium]|nr:nucleotide sugar dehydrogenase [Myxococcota bacterium]MBU1382668.1 nucleotide sugar dehydrogenase [Myxococcota bacterium]MBU1497240.1 nucleotide sugar dehydrogenase [Myxococcota bacterium]